MSGEQFDLCITGGRVYDPASNVDGDVVELWIRDGCVVDAPKVPDAKATRTIDAHGMVVMPGGVDIHCHIAGSKVNQARKLQPEEARRAPVARGPLTRAGAAGSVPTTFVTGYRYAGLGYTTAFDAAIQPLAARHVHEELADTPCIDKGFYALVGNSHFLMESIRAGEPERAREFVAWLINATKAYALKVVNPGGIEMWKQLRAGTVANLDTAVGYFGVTPRQILTQVAAAADELRLPHAVHVHCNHLGLPGNWRTTLDTMRALDGRRAHLTHIQFHSYGGDDETTLSSQVGPLVEYFDAHPNLTADVGQVLFAPTTSMTGDGPLGYFLHKVYGGRWYSADIEQESGCGIVPLEYKQKSLVHAWQWAIGLEWMLTAADPWRLAMSTDHPNGGSFMAYPQIMRLLTSRDYRRDVLATVHPAVRQASRLNEIDREFTLREICIASRAAPARTLGLRSKGHLAPGADADVTIYDPAGDPSRMFELPRFVIKGGRTIIDDGELRAPVDGQTLFVEPEYDDRIERELSDWFRRHYTVQFRNYGVAADEVASPRAIPCGA